MDSKELMLGDWIYVPHNGNATHYARVIGIYSRDVVSTELDKMSGLIKADALEPISLTPEILEKNGFVLKEEEVGMYGVKIAPHYTRDDLPFEVFCDGDPFAIWFNNPVNIKYIHELQHALRLCGIEKEITI